MRHGLFELTSSLHGSESSLVGSTSVAFSNILLKSITQASVATFRMCLVVAGVLLECSTCVLWTRLDNFAQEMLVTWR